MFVILIIFVPLFILIGVDIYYNLGTEMNGRLWARLLLLLLMEMFFLQLINPSLLITVTETGIIVVQNKANIEIGWGDIESYMICGRPSTGDRKSVV